MMPGILITAAGLGSRYRCAGGHGLKLDQPIVDGVSVFQLTLGNACATGLPVHVVTRSAYISIQADCRSMGVAFTCDDTRSLGATIAAGVRHKADWDGWLIQLADMPFVPADIHKRVAEALRHHAAARPYYRQLPGHPVGFSTTARYALLRLRAMDGAQSVLKQFPPYSIEVTDEGVVMDIDLPSHLLRYRT